MNLFKTIRIIGTFYRSFILFSILMTACCLGLYWEYGADIFVALFWVKLLTLGLTYYFINSYKTKEYYYYLNLGLSKRILWTSILLFDFSVFYHPDYFRRNIKMIHTLEADGIQLDYNGRKILSDIYLKCETGKIIGLLGRNGCGKSSLMKIIYGCHVQ